MTLRVNLNFMLLILNITLIFCLLHVVWTKISKLYELALSYSYYYLL